MRVLIDTNILLDVLCNRQGLYESSAKIWNLCETGELTGFVSALSLPNLVYIMRKELDAEKVSEIVSLLSTCFTIADLKGADTLKACGMGFPDYEDALQSTAAERVKADYIVTRNLKDYKNSKVPALKPEELLERI